MTCNYYVVTLHLPAKQFSHCIALTVTRKDMTHSVISIDSINLNSMSTDSSAGKVLDF